MWSPLPFTAGRWIYSSVLFQLKKRARRVNRFSPKHAQEEVETLRFPFKGLDREGSQTDTFEWGLIWWMSGCLADIRLILMHILASSQMHMLFLTKIDIISILTPIFIVKFTVIFKCIHLSVCQIIWIIHTVPSAIYWSQKSHIQNYGDTFYTLFYKLKKEKCADYFLYLLNYVLHLLRHVHETQAEQIYA